MDAIKSLGLQCVLAFQDGMPITVACLYTRDLQRIRSYVTHFVSVKFYHFFLVCQPEQLCIDISCNIIASRIALLHLLTW